MVLNVIQYGMGFIGQKAIQLMRSRGHNLVAAIDVNKDLAGKDAGEVAGIGKLGVKITDNVADVIKNVKADIVSHTTVSKLEPTYEQIKPFIEAGMNVSSIAECLAYPWQANPGLSKEIDENAKKHGVTVVATGVNPGLVMDLIPLTIASACWKVDKVKIARVVDSSVYSPTRGTRRFGIKPEEFRKGVREKTIPMHSGLKESLTMISDALGWKLDDYVETWEVMVSKSVRETQWFTVQPGATCGFVQNGMGLVNGEVKVSLTLYFVIKPNLEEDGVEKGDITIIEGEPSVTIKTTGAPSEQGAMVSTARLVNIFPAIVEAKPGLLAVKDLPASPPVTID